jgi:hypothetical protein
MKKTDLGPFYAYRRKQDNSGDEFIAIPNAKPIVIHEQIETFIYLDKISKVGFWNVVECKTGLALSGPYSLTRKLAIESALGIVTQKGIPIILMAIEDEIKKHGISPRYQTQIAEVKP